MSHMLANDFYLLTKVWFKDRNDGDRTYKAGQHIDNWISIVSLHKKSVWLTYAISLNLDHA